MQIEKPNYTQTPNIIFDLMPQMAEAELRVTLAICRQTFGFHRQADTLSISQLQKATGLSRQGAINGLQAGMERGTITRQPDGNSFAYGLQMAPDAADAETVNQVDTAPVNLVDTAPPDDATSQRSRPALVNLVDHSLVNVVDTQKKDKKERERKGVSASSRARADAPAPSPAPAKPKAVIIYENLVKYPPDVVGEQAIVAAVGEDEPSLKRWGDVVTAWLLSGHRANNVRGMLDWYRDGIPSYKLQENGNGQPGRSAGRRAGPPAPVVARVYDPALEDEFN